MIMILNSAVVWIRDMVDQRHKWINVKGVRLDFGINVEVKFTLIRPNRKVASSYEWFPKNRKLILLH